MLQPTFHINALGHGAIDYLVMLAFILLTIWIGATKPERILYILPAAITFNFFIPTFIELTPFKVVPILLVIVATLTGKRNYFKFKGSFWIYLFLFWFTLCFALSFFWAYAYDYFGLPQSPYKRFFIQFINYFNLFTVYIVTKTECSDKERFNLFVKGFIITTTILCVYGLYQLIAYRFGLPFRWIVYGASGNAIQKITERWDPEELIFRINSLANEPKRLSYVLPLSIFLIVGMRRAYGDAFMSKLRANFLILFHIAMTFFTYSTSLYFALALFFPLIYLLGLFKKTQRDYTKALTLAMLMVVLSLPLYYDYALKVYDMVVTVKLQGMQKYSQYKKPEEFAVEVLRSNPESAALGVGLGGWSFYFVKKTGDTRFIFKTGYLLMNSGVAIMLFDLGLIGFLLAHKHVFMVFFRLRKHKNKLLNYVNAPIILFFFFVSLFLNTYTIYFCFIGAFDGISQYKEENPDTDGLVPAGL